MSDYDKIIKGLPQAPGILNRERFFNSVVLVPFVIIDNKEYILFQKRSCNIRQGGEICFPGGGFDPLVDSDYRDTAIRETYEELGLSKKNIIIGGQMDSLVASMGVIIDIFIGKLYINGIEELNINKNEVEKVFLIPFSYFKNSDPEEYKINLELHPHTKDKNGELIELLPARELGLPEKYHKSWNAGDKPVYLYKTSEGAIWGITAEIIKKISGR